MSTTSPADPARAIVLGCGYVGLELGRHLTADGHEVVGVRRSKEGCRRIRDAGLRAVQADVTDPDDLTAVPDADWLIFAASSGGRGADAARDVYVDGLATTIETFGSRSSVPDRLVYTSSTGVYGDHDGAWVDEETPIDPTTEKTRVLAEAERVAREHTAPYGIEGTVVRLAGLYGPDRYRLERYLQGPVTEGYLNMIHRTDAAGTIAHVLTADIARDDVVLAVDDEPVDKWSFADWLADRCDVEPPPKVTKEQRLDDDDLSTAARRRLQTSKRCSNEYLRSLGYEFRYPTYREGYRDAIREYRGTSGSSPR